MTMSIYESKAVIGVDVAKHELVIYDEQHERLTAIPNSKADIKKWLKNLPSEVSIAIEATGSYHVLFANMAYKAGCAIYMIDGYALSHYRKSVNVRSKTDALDARLLARFLSHESKKLKPWVPPSPLYLTLLSLFRRRAALVKMRVSLTQSWANEPLLETELSDHLIAMRRLEQAVEDKIRDVLDQAGLLSVVKRCMKVEGIGFLTAARLVATYQRGAFDNSDAFIAFLGLDLRQVQSGQKKGQAKLTKRGDSEVRRLLHNAAMSASRSPRWKSYYQTRRDGKYSTTQALVMLARKLARVVFALLKSGDEYQPKTA